MKLNNLLPMHVAKNMALAERKRIIDEARQEVTANGIAQLLDHAAHEGHDEKKCTTFSDPIEAAMVLEQAFAPKVFFEQFGERLWQGYTAAQRIVRLSEQRFGKETASDLIFASDFKHFCVAMFRNFAMTVQNNDMNKELGYIASAKHIGELMSESHHERIVNQARKAYLGGKLKELYPQGEKAAQEMMTIVEEINKLNPQ